MKNKQLDQPVHQVGKSLYTPSLESDACGTGFVANLKGVPTHALVENALTMLQNMEHRGAVGFEANTGDGAGIMTQIPHEFFARKCQELGFELPNIGEYGVGMLFFPNNKNLRNQCRALLSDYADEMDFEVLGYRHVPTDHEQIGDAAISTEPRMEQIFVRPRKNWRKGDLERKLYVLRKWATHMIHATYPMAADHFYIASFSYKTILYKGQLTTFQVRPYFPDLHDAAFKSAIALIHSRFSTNTTPKWKLAQPFRYIAHNGEINTITGNINWWKSKESVMKSTVFSDEDLEKLFPVCGQALSDSANFDNVLEFLVMSGRSMPHALMMMMPEAWQHDPHMPNYKKTFYEYHESMMEAWDGPAAICFTDGVVVGAMLDRNGLRPLRYTLYDDGLLVAASEAGALVLPQEKVVKKGRLQPGKIFIADLDQQRIVEDDEVKKIVCNNRSYQKWIDENKISLKQLAKNQPLTDVKKDFLPPFGGIEGEDTGGGHQEEPVRGFIAARDAQVLQERQILFGFTKEDLKIILSPMARNGEEALGSMGADIPLAILSHQSQHLSHYFKQLFAQVTNPPIDPIRERAMMSLHVQLGACGNILLPTADQARFIALEQPIIGNVGLYRLKNLTHSYFKSEFIDITFDADAKKGKLHAALTRICASAEEAVRSGANILILSDREADILNAPIPSLLATGAVHHHLIRQGLRSNCSIVVEAGDVREVHHFATLIGYGAQAINPYMAFATIFDLCEKGVVEHDFKKAISLYIKAIGKGLLKVMSKIGISTLQSYAGAQIFEAVGIGEEVIDFCFKKTISRISGLTFDQIAEETLARHQKAFPNHPPSIQAPKMASGGIYQWKRDGEAHLFNPKSIHFLQVAARNNDWNAYRNYAKEINKQDEQAFTLRGLLSFRKGNPIPLSEVESVETIFKRFSTGAMSFGSISHEAHSTLAIAMNRIGGRSNSGEGGEDETRYQRLPNGDSMRSAIKQVASGRFGVTSYYLSQADEIQIKMAQGAKPGEGGQLPGHKVDEWIGRVRHATPGVGLISPPPHHDIYSIEDLSQLIFDLKNANPKADINVKLVSKAGVGVIASGVAKAKADKILISGFDGGTGASPISSIQHAGLPWELGIAEAHQTLVRNRLRTRVRLQADGQIRTGRDLAIATLLGAEEWGVATASLIVEGCIMMRKCHVNTCPVGIATQDPVLRSRFTGKPEHIVNFFTFLAQDLREIMAQLGFKTIDEMVGQAQMLKFKPESLKHQKYAHLDLTPILYQEPIDENVLQYKSEPQQLDLKNVLDRKLIRYAKNSLDEGKFFHSELRIKNTDRAVGTLLSYEISSRYGAKGLPLPPVGGIEGGLRFRFRGSAGQSFGAFGAHGLHFVLEGEANDYFGKGLSGATLIVVPDRKATFDPTKNIILGNVALYGATSGEIFVRGQAGERFAVRNSGATAVVEGVGEHACEYMTGGIVVVLGETGRNFAAGMSGGVAYVFLPPVGGIEGGQPPPPSMFRQKCNPEMVEIESLDAIDVTTLHGLIRRHASLTGSLHAVEILNDWEIQQQFFVKVMPRDYKIALQKAAEKEKLKVLELVN
ncbi:MAG: hypothetical protein RL757_3168 [Bacteroidota bacterium]|jgi:glutamate synthase (NADPH/NADH) large chain